MEREKLTIFYNDTVSSVSKIIGEILREEPDFVEVKTISGLVKIPMQKIIRIERQGDGQDAESDKRRTGK